MTCSLSQWKDVSLALGLPGLCWKDRKLQIDAPFFKCCEGRGLRWDAPLEVARSCKLQNRKRKIDSLLKKFEEAWPGASFPAELKCQDRRFFIHWLTRLEKQSVQYGYATSCKRDGASPSSFWSLALMSTWRFGFTSHVFSMGRSKDHEIIPHEVAASDYPLIYFLDGVNELWKPKYKEQVSTIINWCEQSEVPLWLEIREAPQANPVNASPLDLKEAFRSYIAKMKSRPVLNWLDEECLSRLLRVSSKGVPLDFLKEMENVRVDT